VALRIVSSEYRYFFRGPYFRTTSKGQTVYRVTVEDKPGRLRTGWVRCGGWWLGLMSNHVEACWDETPSQGVAVPRDRWLDDRGCSYDARRESAEQRGSRPTGYDCR
jgi:hypothetical protein